MALPLPSSEVGGVRREAPPPLASTRGRAKRGHLGMLAHVKSANLSATQLIHVPRSRLPH